MGTHNLILIEVLLAFGCAHFNTALSKHTVQTEKIPGFLWKQIARTWRRAWKKRSSLNFKMISDLRYEA